MALLQWYKRNPEAALVGMRGLTAREKAAYNTVLDLIYCHEGRLRDDDVFIGGWVEIDGARGWRRIKKRLIAKGKLRVSGGYIHNGRASREIAAALKKMGSVANELPNGCQTVANHLPHANRVLNDINGIQPTDSESEEEEERERYARESAGVFVNGSGKGNQDERHEGPGIDPAWAPSAKDRADAIGEIGVAPADIERTARDFVDYYLASGRDKACWSSAWRIHCRRAVHAGFARPAHPRADKRNTSGVVAALGEVIDLHRRKVSRG